MDNATHIPPIATEEYDDEDDDDDEDEEGVYRFPREIITDPGRERLAPVSPVLLALDAAVIVGLKKTRLEDLLETAV